MDKLVRNSKRSFLDYLNKDIGFSRKGLRNSVKRKIYSELTILYSANVDLRTCFEIIEEGSAIENEKKIFNSIIKSLEDGNSLSEHMKSCGIFSPYEYYSIRIGEESGKLGEIFMELFNYFEIKIKTRRQIVSALSYPAIVVSVAFFAIVFMMNFVVPMFADVFKRFNSELPPITQFIISVSNILSQKIYFILLTICIIIGAVLNFYKTNRFQKMYSSLILKIPYLGKTYKKVYLSRFSYTFNLLLSSKAEIIYSLELIKEMISFYPIESTINTIKEDIISGKSLYESLKKHTFYDKRMIALVKVGEEVNQLDLIFKKLADDYSREVEHETKQMSTIIEPLIIVFLGGFVGVVLIAMYLPLFQLGSSIK
jgi:type IV pilus assembly protein PilC